MGQIKVNVERFLPTAKMLKARANDAFAFRFSFTVKGLQPDDKAIM